MNLARKRKNDAMPPDTARAVAEMERQQAAYEAAVAQGKPLEDVVLQNLQGDGSSHSAVDDADLAFYPQTDLGNAERFAARFRDKAIHVREIGWYWWDGRRWAQQGAEGVVERAAHSTARAIQDEAAAIRGTADDPVIARKKNGDEVRFSDKLAAHGRASESANKLSAIVRLAAAYLTVEAAKLDADPWRINVLNGTIWIERESGEDPVRFKPHDPTDLITKLAPVEFDHAAECPLYDRFLAEVQPEPKARRFLHAWGGYSLTGDVEEQKLTFWYGKGRNGKSTLIDTWSAVAGDYGETVPIETFTDQGRGRNAGQATPDLALLPGVRMLRTSEPEKGAKLAEALIKLVTGGEPIQARHLHGPYFKFRPSFKLTMGGNYRPQISGADEGIWRRIILVPFAVTVAKPELHLLAKLKAETSGILNRLLDGLRDYLDNGLTIPDVVAEATQDYREDSDPLGRFLAACVEQASGERVASRRMHEIFCAWSKAVGEREWSPKGLAMAMKERGFRLKHTNGSFWLDCRLCKSEVDFGSAVSPAPPFDEVDER